MRVGSGTGVGEGLAGCRNRSKSRGSGPRCRRVIGCDEGIAWSALPSASVNSEIRSKVTAENEGEEKMWEV